MQKSIPPPEWPVIRHYDADHLSQITLPVGGIGTGTLSLAGNGELRDWEIMNRPAKGFQAGPGGNQAPFFALWIREPDEAPLTRGLMGPVNLDEYQSAKGTRPNCHGVPRFRECSFDAAYPFGQVRLDDADLPVRVRVKAFNPLIPGDAENSGLPIALLRFEVTNKTRFALQAAICGNLENFIGIDGSKRQPDWGMDLVPVGAQKNRNHFRQQGPVAGLFLNSDGVDPQDEAWGTIALTVPSDAEISCRTVTRTGGWGEALLDLWDDFSADGKLEQQEIEPGNTPLASLAVSKTIPPEATVIFEFYLTWHFPNRCAWANSIVGNYYCTRFSDAWEVAFQTVPRLPELEAETLKFVNAICESDFPAAVKEAALFNLTALRSQTSFRTADGLFFGWEGCHDRAGCCQGSCTHVWNYEQATAFLFGDLAQKMRTVEFGQATNAAGLMSFRVNLPVEQAQSFNVAAADGQMGTLMRVYRDWQLSGNDALLQKLWPNIRRALEFCWIKGGWDGDCNGVMEGQQHNTMDVEYYGPNPQMQFWYLGALRACAEMAQYLGETDFAETCRQLFTRGREWTAEHLFNGEYFRQIIQPPLDIKIIARGLTFENKKFNPADPEFQLGNGCLVDQLVGQFMAHICGLGYLIAPELVHKALESILKYNYRESVHAHFNNMRSFVLGDEAALLMASFPHDRPKNPFPYFSEVMTGFEYTAAIGMLYEGMTAEGIKCIENVRARYDGRKRSPFDEAECGHHYARAMAAWAGLIALAGFHYSAVTQTLEFTAKSGKYFWSNGYAYGMVKISAENQNRQIELRVLRGELRFRILKLAGFGEKLFEASQVLHGEVLRAEVVG